MRNNTPQINNTPYSAYICFAGFAAHLLLSGALLYTLGFKFASSESSVFEKFHPGSLLILLSFIVFLFELGNPVRRLAAMYCSCKVFSLFLLQLVLLTFYVVLRSGLSGSALLPDTHITVVICSIIFTMAPVQACRKLLLFYLAFAVINSSLGIIESAGRFRIFTYDPTWVVLREQSFRASALMGHPLNNAMFTCVALFVAAALKIKPLNKAIILSLLFISSVAFGGRAGLAYNIVGMTVLGMVILSHIMRAGLPSMRKMVVAYASVFIIPILFLAGLILALNSGLGERIIAHSEWDDSANSRFLALQVFDFMTLPEVLFGISTDKIVEIAYRMNLVIPLSDIENPWLLMLIYFGVIMFSFWFMGTLAFAWKLMHGQPLALNLAVLAYYITASTSNSFGRKDSNYLIMATAVVCAIRVLAEYKRDVVEESPTALCHVPPAT